MNLSLSNVAAISGVLVGATLANAQTDNVKWKVKGKLRGDAYQSSTETKVGEGEKDTKKSSSLLLKRAQLEFVGTKGAVDLHIKYYADKNYLKNVFVEYNISPSCSVSFGKFDARDYSLEWDYSTTDNYIFSTPGSDAFSIANAPGVEAKGIFGDNALYFQVIQGATPKDTTFKSTGGLTSTLQYRGSFNDGMIRPIATYAMVRTAGNHGTVTKTNADLNYGNGYSNHMGLGVKFVVAGSTTDVEYDTVKMIKQKDLESSKDENIGSFILQSRMPAFADVTPYVKVIVETDKKGADENSGDVARTAFALGAEYAWATNVRVHGIFSQDASKTTKFDTVNNKASSGDTKASTTAFNFGLTASI